MGYFGAEFQERDFLCSGSAPLPILSSRRPGGAAGSSEPWLVLEAGVRGAGAEGPPLQESPWCPPPGLSSLAEASPGGAERGCNPGG